MGGRGKGVLDFFYLFLNWESFDMRITEVPYRSGSLNASSGEDVEGPEDTGSVSPEMSVSWGGAPV